MNTYITLSGRSIEYQNPGKETSAFLKRVELAVDNPEVSRAELLNLIYGPENPILDRQQLPGRAIVTAQVFENPIYHILSDMLGRKEVALGLVDLTKAHARYTVDVPTAANQLGITAQAIRNAIDSYRLSAILKDGQWWIHPQSIASFRVSKAGRPKNRDRQTSAETIQVG